jgi:hypothetical protein
MARIMYESLARAVTTTRTTGDTRMTQVTDEIAATNAARRGKTAVTMQPTTLTWLQLVTLTGVTTCVMTDTATDVTTIGTIEETIIAVDLEVAAAIGSPIQREWTICQPQSS